MANRLDSIIPRPARSRPAAGVFRLDENTRILAEGAAEPAATLLNEYLRHSTGRALRLDSDRRGGSIGLRLREPTAGESPEAYQLRITGAEIDLVAPDIRGLLCGIQTIRQLLPTEALASSPWEWALPCGEIDDSPRFRWRGVMLDCARHFMPVEYLYKWIDLLALHKFNVFHWHLTEDQGWRIEIKKYPRLTEIGAWRRNTLIGHALPFRDASEYSYDSVRHGGFYTQAQIRKLVAFAAARNVTIVPEIEMPGHSQAAIAAYPELGNLQTPLEVWNHWGISKHILNVEESTINFYKDVLREVMDLFPSTFIHVGGDEAPKDQWKASLRVQERMRELGVKDEHELQSWFIRQMDAFLEQHGRRLIGWDEILEGGLAPGAAVMSWRGEDGGIAAARAGHDVVMAPQGRLYFDHYQTSDTRDEPLAIGGHNPIEKVYTYDPVPAGFSEEEAAHVLGAQAQLWTEYMPTFRDVERMAFPRACAMAEVLWSARTSKGDWSDFSRRLALHAPRLRLLDVGYHKSLEPR